MGFDSMSEDMQDRIDENMIHNALAQFRDHQLASLKKGTLTEEAFRQAIGILEKRIIEPIEAINRQAGADGLTLGNQLLKLQAEIKQASSVLERHLTEFEAQTNPNEGDLTDAITAFVEQYRKIFNVLEFFARLLNAQNRSHIKQIKIAAEKVHLAYKKASSEN